MRSAYDLRTKTIIWSQKKRTKYAYVYQAECERRNYGPDKIYQAT